MAKKKTVKKAAKKKAAKKKVVGAVERPLKPRQEAFCHEYVKLDPDKGKLNATKAAIAAGYSEHTAAQQACRLLKDVRVQTRINELLRKMFKKVDIDATDYMRRLKEILDVNPVTFYSVDGDVITISTLRELPENVQKMIMEIVPVDIEEGEGDEKISVSGYRVKLMSKDRAMESVGKVLGVFRETHEHDFKEPMQINVIKQYKGEKPKDEDGKSNGLGIL